MTSRTRGSGTAWSMLAPFSIGVALLLVVPMLLTLRYAFTSYTGFGTPELTGLDNVTRALGDPTLRASLRASLFFLAAAVPLRMLAATAMGIALARPLPGAPIWRILFALPTFVPELTLTLTTLWLFNPRFGPVNRVLGALGLPEPVWLADPWGARWAIVALLLLPIGEAFIVVLAGRQALDGEVYDAAAVDGAGHWQTLRHVTLPRLAPLLLALTIRDIILTLQVNVGPAYLLTDGGPANATLFLPVYVFDQAFEFLAFGYGAFLTLLLLVITGAMCAALLLLARRWGWLPARS